MKFKAIQYFQDVQQHLRELNLILNYQNAHKAGLETISKTLEKN